VGGEDQRKERKLNLMNVSPNIPVYRASDSPIEVAVHKTFAIALESNPTTGYAWEPVYDSAMLELLGQKFDLQSHAIGGGGEESFEFQAQQPGETQVKMSYQREWEDQPLETRIYTINIKQ
jgi:inhibitor of cysteine peptidase